MIDLLYNSIDHWAEKTPAQEAFRFQDTALTYAELAQASAKLAAVLLENGVQPGDRVGVCLHKSLQTPVAIYGIMKAGAAFVPIDPATAPDRMRKILAHCGIKCVVSNPDMQVKLAEVLTDETLIGVKIDGVHSLDWAQVNRATPAMPVKVAPDDIAYIMYTSGSTGTPKGITHTHASGLAYAHAISRLYGITADDRFGNHAPLHFDISTFDYFAAPLNGATTVIIPEPYMMLPASLSALMAAERLTLWFSAPNALTQLLLNGALELHNLSSLRWVIFGGEPFPPKYLRGLMKAWPDARFSNAFGPAEVNVCSYYHAENPFPDQAAVPIGQIWDIAEGLIVDENDNEVTQGELLVNAPTMMRGYWRAPDLNARCFFTRTGPDGTKQTFYRTGDLVAKTAPDCMQFLGRKDRQVKLRGYRIELDEIELVLTGHDDVEEAGAFKALSGARIEAAVTLKPGADMGKQTLQRHCATKLPGYAVPSVFHIIQAFPRTTSQKIDRRALGFLFDDRADIDE